MSLNVTMLTSRFSAFIVRRNMCVKWLTCLQYSELSTAHSNGTSTPPSDDNDGCKSNCDG